MYISLCEAVYATIQDEAGHSVALIQNALDTELYGPGGCVWTIEPPRIHFVEGVFVAEKIHKSDICNLIVVSIGQELLQRLIDGLV